MRRVFIILGLFLSYQLCQAADSMCVELESEEESSCHINGTSSNIPDVDQANFKELIEIIYRESVVSLAAFLSHPEKKKIINQKGSFYAKAMIINFESLDLENVEEEAMLHFSDCTPFYYAVQMGNLDIVKQLVKAGAQYSYIDVMKMYAYFICDISSKNMMIGYLQKEDDKAFKVPVGRPAKTKKRKSEELIFKIPIGRPKRSKMLIKY